MNATSAYLNLRCRTPEEVLEARDEANSGSRGSTDETADSLEYLIARTRFLIAEFEVRHGKNMLGKVDLGYEMGGLSDVLGDLEGKLQDHIDRERNWR